MCVLEYRVVESAVVELGVEAVRLQTKNYKIVKSQKIITQDKNDADLCFQDRRM